MKRLLSFISWPIAWIFALLGKKPKQSPPVEDKSFEFSFPPGTKVWEMIVVSLYGLPVKGLDPETGSFDPDLADVVPAEYHKNGSLVITDGNLYEVASNAKNARRKIIAKYFPK